MQKLNLYKSTQNRWRNKNALTFTHKKETTKSFESDRVDAFVWPNFDKIFSFFPPSYQQFLYGVKEPLKRNCLGSRTVLNIIENKLEFSQKSFRCNIVPSTGSIEVLNSECVFISAIVTNRNKHKLHILYDDVNSSFIATTFSFKLDCIFNLNFSIIQWNVYVFACKLFECDFAYLLCHWR